MRIQNKNKTTTIREGIIDFSQPRKKTKKKKDKDKEINKEEETPYENTTLDMFMKVKEAQTTLEHFQKI